MLKRIVAVVTAAMLILPLLLTGCESQNPAAARPNPSESASPINMLGSYRLLTIPAPSLAESLIGEAIEQEIGVYLPPGYQDGPELYPVLYFLTDFDGDYIFSLIHLSDAMESWVGSRYPGFIVVSVKGQNRFGGSFYANSPITGNWEDYITQDLVSYMDTNYRTLATPEYRFLCGHGMGGAAVINIAMNRPGLFGKVYAMSPTVMSGRYYPYAFNLDQLKGLQTRYEDMDTSAAVSDYNSASLLDSISPNFTTAYASAFAYDGSKKPPYVFIPSSRKDWRRYESGIGDWDKKISRNADALKTLDGFKIDYGIQDQFAWLSLTIRDMEQSLIAYEIPCVIEPYLGGHSDQIPFRLREAVIPWFVIYSSALPDEESEESGLNEDMEDVENMNMENAGE